jgi:ATP-binding cassette, subfamily B, bacterial
MSSEPRSQRLAQISAFARLRARAGRQIELVTQLTASDCGPACLAMVLGYHGRSLPLDEIRAAMGGSAQGVSARQIAECARQYGLRARGVMFELDKLRYLPKGAILHWEMNHFVVLESADARGARIIDPSCGPRRVSARDMAERCTGIALLCEPSAEFKPLVRGRSARTARYLRWLHAAPGYWPRVLVLSAVMQLVTLAVPAAMSLTVDKIIPRHDAELLHLLAAGCLAIWSIQFVASYLRSSLLLHLRTYMDAQMTIDLNEHVLHLPFGFFQQRATGDLVMRLTSSTQIRELLSSAALSLILDGGMALVYGVLLLALAPLLAAIAMGVALTQALVVLLSGRRNAELMAEQLVTQARLSSSQVEALAAIEPIKSMGAERRIAERWADLYVDSLNSTLARGALTNQVGALTGAFAFAGPLALLLTGAHLVLSGSLGVGAMLALSSLGSAFLTPVASLASMWTQLQTLRSYLERLEDLLDTETEPRRAQPPAGTPVPLLRGQIELRNASFAYRPGAALVLDQLNLAIKPGEFLAIVGQSGSGKSTLARLLAGLYEPLAGSIHFEKLDSKLWDPTLLRSMLGMVTQDARLMAASIRDNITLFDATVPLSQVQRAASLAEMHEHVMSLPMQYDSVLSDGGGSLSGGQRQRLCLARALLRQPRVVVLDEATSQLDTITERLLHQRLAALRCTRIVIAHRLSTIRDADRIVVLDAGRLLAVGRHAELMARCRLYNELVGSQPAGPTSASLTR